jgi:undecaprenyl-diphosphatase
MESLLETFVHFVADHPRWTALILCVVAFGESLPFLSLLFPGTALLIAEGTLVPDGVLAVGPAVSGAIIGAVLGDGLSYWIGRRFGHAVTKVWPFTRHPHLLSRGIAYFQRYGGVSVFAGRFLGPLRAVVPLAAGILQMSPLRFWLANIASAVVWAPGLLLPGTIAVAALNKLGLGKHALPLAIALLVFLGLAVSLFVASRRSKN